MQIAPAPPAIRQRLDPHERLLWWGRPPRGLLLRKSDWFVIPFSLVWCGGALAGVRGALKGGSILGVAFTGLFVAFGFYFLIGRFIHDAWQRGGTYYAVTPTRALIVTAKAVNGIELAGLSQVTLRETRNGRGSIIFGPEEFRDSEGDTTTSKANGSPVAPTFEAIDDVGEVYALIRRIQAALARR